MPRNKTLLLKGGGGSSGVRGHRISSRTSSSSTTSTTTTKKIVIKPFVKPPSLPPNYYETTSEELLTQTLGVVLLNTQQSSSSCRSRSRSQSGNNNSNNNKGSSSSSIMSLQNAYTAVVQLVSHDYGPQLYKDLRTSMQQAAALVLLPDNNTAAAGPTTSSPTTTGATITTSTSTTTTTTTLEYIPTQYQRYLDYLLCCKHVFLPLDRTHGWHVSSESAISLVGGGGGSVATTSGSSNNSSSTTTTLNIWQVGLQQFAKRLQALQLDESLYQEWLQLFWNDWSGQQGSSTSGGGSGSSNLKAVWYLWQDLGLLASLSLQADLENYWKAQAEQWKQEPYRASVFLQYAYDKHQKVRSLWPWLPSVWLHSILEQCLFQPHYNTDYLLKEENLFPLFAEELFYHTQTTTANAATTTSSSSLTTAAAAATSSSVSPIRPALQLWILAGRLPNGQQAVAAALAKFAKQQGSQSVQKYKNQKSNTQVISDLLSLQDGLNSLIASLMQARQQPKQHLLAHAAATATTTSQQQTTTISLKNVWEEVVNVDTTPSVAESLAKFLDQILRSNKKMDQYQTQHGDDWLQRIVMGLFVPIQAKDVFEAFYKRDLAKRLLWNRVVSMDIEKQVCSLLKAECGAGYTSKMEGMFQDVDWSRETMMVYKQSMTGSSGGSSSPSLSSAAATVEMEVQVLTTGYWPVYPQYPNLNLPDSLREPQERFANHYKTKYQGRRMTWQYALGHCLVRANGFSKAYELIVSLCQALVLIQFTETERKWTLPTLMQAVGLEDRDEMERIMQSLSLGKEGTRILRKIDFDAAKKKKIRMTVDDRDEFVVFNGFESNQRRIRINNIMMKETKEEREKTVETVSRDRLYLIDAVLVRIMKARKTISHQSLIAQVLEQVKVPAQASDVKKRIESLIEREYLERDPKDRNRYNYLA